MIDVKATVRVGNVFAAFTRLRKIDIKNTFRLARAPARKDQKDHKAKLEGPSGAWVGLAPSTIERRRRKRGRDKRGRQLSWPKRLLGRLPNAMQEIVTSSSLTLRSRVRKFSYAHQAGPMRVGRGAILPGRQFMWISDWLKGEVRDLFTSALYAAWVRG